jgi:hypothetical protein
MQPLNLTDKPKPQATGEKPSAAIPLPSEIVLSNKVTFMQGGLSISSDCTQLEWFNLMVGLRRVGDAYKSYLGDAVRFGESAFGPQIVTETCAQLEFALVDVKHGREIASIPVHKRAEYAALQADHFYVVSHFIEDDIEREKWLKIAVKEKLNAVELKESINSGGVVHHHTSAKTAGRGSGGIYSVQALSFTFQNWKRQVGEDYKSWTPEIKKEFLDQTAEIAKFREEVAMSLK